MRQLLLGITVLGSMIAITGEASAACYYDYYGRLICEQRKYYQPERHYNPNHYGPRYDYRYDGGYRGRQRGACANPAYTVQDGVCKPYSGR